MPSTSKKQEKFMRAVAHSPEFAKKVGVSQSVGKEFNEADKKKHLVHALRRGKKTSGSISSEGSAARALRDKSCTK
jgi:hypothetical protein